MPEAERKIQSLLEFIGGIYRDFQRVHISLRMIAYSCIVQIQFPRSSLRILLVSPIFDYWKSEEVYADTQKKKKTYPLLIQG